MRSYLLTRMRSEAMRQTLEVNFKIAVLFLAEGKQTFFSFGTRIETLFGFWIILGSFGIVRKTKLGFY